MKKLIAFAVVSTLSLTSSAAVLDVARNFAATPITQAECALLTSDASVNITLSKGNIGSYMCDSTSANIGIAIGNTSGKNKVFSLGTTGGSITETATRSAPTNLDTSSVAVSVATGMTVLSLQDSEPR